MVNYGFVIDNRTCIGCHACTVACKSEHDVPIGVNRTHVKYIETGTYPDSSREFSVHRCNHCEDAPCTTICPTYALFTRDDGIVDFDNDRCIGCKSCMQACPYDALYIDPNEGTAAKCNYCAHRVENSYEPACVIVCPTESIISGDLEDPNSQIALRIAENDVKVRKPEAGTKPNVYYVETSDEMLDPAATEVTGVGMWTDQAHGVGHFAKYADSRLAEADTPSMLVQLALEKKAKAANPRDQAIIRDVMAKLEQDKPKATRAYDQPSKGILWDGEVAAYIVTKAAASGFYILLMLLMMYGINEIEWLILPGFFVSIVLLGVTGLLLVKDLDKPGRFLYVLLRPNWDSWLVRGAFILSGFGAILCTHVVVSMLDYAEIWHTRLAYAGIPLAWMTGAYTGWLLKQAKGRTMWAQRSDSEIALTATIEMLIYGGLPLIILWLTDWQQPESQMIVGASVVMAVIYWFGFKHIRHGLREAQMDPLL
jgi:Fe-S-cluster-containing dehydrogenase component